MREIKFRAWNKSYKRWSDHCELELLDDGDGIVLDYLNEEIEVMQFTGLKDRNGKEIYEGDIFDAHSDFAVVIFNTSTACFDIVLGWPDGDCEPLVGPDGWDPNYGSGIEVCGNIHENRELLK